MFYFHFLKHQAFFNKKLLFLMKSIIIIDPYFFTKNLAMKCYFFYIRTFNRFRDMEQTLRLGYLEVIPKVIKKKIDTSIFKTSSHELAVQISLSYVAPFLRSSTNTQTHKHTNTQTPYIALEPSFIV